MNSQSKHGCSVFVFWVLWERFESFMMTLSGDFNFFLWLFGWLLLKLWDFRLHFVISEEKYLKFMFWVHTIRFFRVKPRFWKSSLQKSVGTLKRLKFRTIFKKKEKIHQKLITINKKHFCLLQINRQPSYKLKSRLRSQSSKSIEN